MLISRTQSRLDEAKADVEKLNVKAQTVAVDFSNATEANYAQISKALEGKFVSVLGMIIVW